MALPTSSDEVAPRRHRGSHHESAKSNRQNESTYPGANPVNLDELRQARLDYLSKSPEDHRKAAATLKQEKLISSEGKEKHRKSRPIHHAKPRKMRASKEQSRRKKQDDEDIYVYGPPPTKAVDDSAAAAYHGALDTGNEKSTRGRRASKGDVNKGRPSHLNHPARVSSKRMGAPPEAEVASLPRRSRKSIGQTRSGKEARGRSRSSASGFLTSSEVASANDVRPHLHRSKTASTGPGSTARLAPTIASTSHKPLRSNDIRPPRIQAPSTTSVNTVQDFRSVARAESLRQRRDDLISRFYFKVPSPIAGRQRNSVTMDSCLICLDDHPSNTFPKLNCECKYCPSCLEKYFRDAIKDKTASSVPVKCCKMEIPLRSIYPYIKHDKEFMQAYNIMVHDRAVGSCRCPAKNCGKWIGPHLFQPVDKKGTKKYKATAGRKQGTCPICHMKVCLACKSQWHPGPTCPDDEGFVESERMRKCPSCAIVLIRDAGCLHMTCQCRYEFCWRCGAKYSMMHACPPEFGKWEEQVAIARKKGKQPPPRPKLDESKLPENQGGLLDPKAEQEKEEAEHRAMMELLAEEGMGPEEMAMMGMAPVGGSSAGAAPAAGGSARGPSKKKGGRSGKAAGSAQERKGKMKGRGNAGPVDPFQYMMPGDRREGWFPPGQAHGWPAKP